MNFQKEKFDLNNLLENYINLATLIRSMNIISITQSVICKFNFCLFVKCELCTSYDKHGHLCLEIKSNPIKSCQMYLGTNWSFGFSKLDVSRSIGCTPFSQIDQSISIRSHRNWFKLDDLTLSPILYAN